MKRRLIVSLLASVGAFGVSANDVSTQIINGTPATVADYTNFASLYVETDTQYSTRSFCGATVINDHYVLTAAHCIVGNESLLPNVTVPVGLQDESTYIPGAYPRVVEYHFPSTYVDSEVALWPDDIAILKLDNPIGTGDLYSMLNFSRDRDYDGNDIFTAVGHGKQVYDEAPNANDPNLLEAPLLYVSTAVCTADQGSNITEKQICFNGANGPTYRNAICSGDSGGPIYVSRSGGPQIQVGIASFGYTVCGLDSTNTTTSVFTEIYDYKAWIDNVIADNATPAYEVKLVNGSRTLIDNNAPATINSVEESSGDSGGSFSVNSLLSLLFVSFLVRLRRKASLGKK